MSAGAVADAFARALVDVLRPRVLLLSLAPLLVMLGLAALLGWAYWGAAVAWAAGLINGSGLWQTLWGWMAPGLAGGVQEVLPTLLVLLAATPLLVIGALTLVALLMTPAMVRQVAARRFPDLAARGDASLLRSVGWSLGSTAAALLALLVSVPLWFIPPLILVVPPLIWGWLTYRVMSFDTLATHASTAERRTLLRQHRMPLLLMGVLCGYLGAAPGIVWASGLVFVALFWLLVPVAIWIYTLVFAFSSLWFAHYGLAALQRLRAAQPVDAPVSIAKTQGTAPTSG